MSLTNEMSPADVKALVGNDGFMEGNGAWWLIILFLFAFCGGNWGNGGFNNGGGYISDNYALISDNATLERKIDGVYSGICDSTFALNNAINNGFTSANANIVQQGFETRNAITQDTIANMQGFNGVNSAIKDCCCQTQQNIKDVNYNLAMQGNGITQTINNGFCQSNFANATNTRDLIDNQNANTRAILEAINTNKVEALKEKIAEQNQYINALNLSASQQAQNNYLISQLRPSPVPAYNVPNPFVYNNGCGNGCGC